MNKLQFRVIPGYKYIKFDKPRESSEQHLLSNRIIRLIKLTQQQGPLLIRSCFPLDNVPISLSEIRISLT